MKNEKLKISLIQIEGKETPEMNSKLIKSNLKKSLKYNPDILFTPECSNIITGDKKHLIKVATTQANCPVLYECMQFAARHSKFISIGSLLLKKNNSKKMVNRSFLINDKGKIVIYYDKIHLFDVRINKKETYFESETFNKGKKIVISESPWGKIGLTICYDIRFPNLYRNLARSGCSIILVPAAFTIPTSKQHWKVLLQSRAIENSCYIIAAAQTGIHHGGRKTYGHSMVVDPWGKIILKSSKKQGVFSLILDLKLIDKVRNKIPSIYCD